MNNKTNHMENNIETGLEISAENGANNGVSTSAKSDANSGAKSGENSSAVSGAKTARIWEIDALRGCAIILMVFFHLLVDLSDFFGYDIVYYELPWMPVGKASAILFMLISGVSCSLSGSNIRRGIRVFLYGMVVTAATFFFVRELYIRFGILHFLGSAMVIWGMTDRLLQNDRAKRLLLYVSSPSFIILGIFFDRMRVDNPYLFVFGLITNTFTTYDYYPLIPWLGVFFVGVAFGLLFYKGRAYTNGVQGKAQSLFPGTENRLSKQAAYVLAWLMAMGRRSLLIYILHQPLMLAILFVIHWFLPGD